MLTEIEAHSPWQVDPLEFSFRESETDLIQCRNVEGLDPVKASLSTTPFGLVDGASYTGGSVADRNIVLTLRPNPDWIEWTYEKLRNVIYSYFIPKKSIQLIFRTDEKVPVKIDGIVEDISLNMFSKDPEFFVSIICPDPHFIALTSVVHTGVTVNGAAFINTEVIPYNGTVETGINLTITKASGQPNPGYIMIRNGYEPNFHSVLSVNGDLPDNPLLSDAFYFEMNTVPLNKYVRNVPGDNLLNRVVMGPLPWTTLLPGDNGIVFYTDFGIHNYELTYFERFGGI